MQLSCVCQEQYIYMNLKATHDCREELRNADLKITPARLDVLHILERSDIPIDAATILSDLQKQNILIDKVTVFRILNSLTDKGILRPIQFNEGKLRYEYAAKPKHHHFICERCGKIIDIEGCVLDSLQKDIEKKKGVLVKRHSLEFFGLCADCQK